MEEEERARIKAVKDAEIKRTMEQLEEWKKTETDAKEGKDKTLTKVSEKVSMQSSTKSVEKKKGISSKIFLI